MNPAPIQTGAPARAALPCPKCGGGLETGSAPGERQARCGRCGAEAAVFAFPRLFREPVRSESAVQAAANEAVCAFFPELRAEVACAECGCFLSARAAVEWSGRELCLPCLHRIRQRGEHPDFLGTVHFHDNRALALVTVLAPLSLFTAPAALFLLLRHRGPAGGFRPKGRWVRWAAWTLTVGWLLLWTGVFVAWIALLAERLR